MAEANTNDCAESGGMQTFESIVKNYATSKENKDIPNSTIEHAYIGVKHLFKNSTGAVRIFCKSFYEPFWSRFEVVFSEFFAVASSNMVEVITIDNITNNQIAHNLSKQYSSKMRFLHLLSDKTTEVFPNAESFPHFMVIEPFGYRFETSDRDKQNALVNGIINFGDKDGSKALVKAFDFLKEKATEPICFAR